MALNDTFTKKTKHSGKPAGDKHSDGGGMYLLVNATGKYWRMNYRIAHAVKDANGRAYNRTAHLPARKAMMQRWADYLDGLRTGGNVVQFRKA